MLSENKQNTKKQSFNKAETSIINSDRHAHKKLCNLDLIMISKNDILFYVDINDKKF